MPFYFSFELKLGIGVKFRTELKLEKSAMEIDPFEGMLFLGSCFSGHMGERFDSIGLPVVKNPFGVVFHPLPLLDIIDKAGLKDFSYSDTDLFQHLGKSYSLGHHGSYTSIDSEILIDQLNKDLSVLRKGFNESKTICLTLGTSWGYHKGEVLVANCHKLPQKFFTKKLSSSSEIKERLIDTLSAFERKFPCKQIILTISPIRHVKDGLVENNRSKAQLITAVHDVVDELEFVHYFPSYELVMDDLRDYRFCTADLVHPNDMAIDYVQEGFEAWGMSEKSRMAINELKKFKSFKNHRVLSEVENDRQVHLDLIDKKRKELSKKYPRATV